MIEKHIYQCEVCGKEFNDEEDCRKHEMEHNAASMKWSTTPRNLKGQL